MNTKIKTGISYLDKILQGGFEKGSLIEVIGDAGAGKSTFGLQFAREGAKNKEKVLYISFEEPMESLKKTALGFGWDLDRQKNLSILTMVPFNFDKTFKNIVNTIKKKKPDRLVLDTVTCLSLYITKPRWKAPLARSSQLSLFTPSLADVRRGLYELAGELRKAGQTVLLLSEDGKDFQVASEVLKFISDGVIKIKISELETKVSRTLEVIKMRRVDHPLDIFPMEINKNGLSIKPLED